MGKERFLLFTRTTPRAKNSSEKARAAPPRLWNDAHHMEDTCGHDANIFGVDSAFCCPFFPTAIFRKDDWDFHKCIDLWIPWPFFSISFSRIATFLGNFNWSWIFYFSCKTFPQDFQPLWATQYCLKSEVENVKECLKISSVLPAVLNVRISFPLIWVLLESRWVWRPLKFSSSSVCKLTHFKQLGSFYRKKEIIMSE